MTGPTVTYCTNFRRQRESRLTTPPQAPCATVSAQDAPAHAPAPATPVARLLALAHHVERLVEAGELKDYAEAARRLGMAKSHMTHVTNLLSLAPDIQEALVHGCALTTERRLRTVCSLLGWEAQRQTLASVPGRS